MPVTIEVIPTLQTNYCYIIQGESWAAVVDPGEASVIPDLPLVAILITHSHHDHVGGVKELLKANPNLKVFGHKSADIPGLNYPLEGGEKINLEQISIEVLHTPAHTLCDLCFYVKSESALFCGDTLFGAGCGRFFEGSPEQAYESFSKLATLPVNTKIYFGHEYTADNIRFAKTLEPGNTQLSTRDSSAPTSPSTLDLELKTNPFLRTQSPELISNVRKRSGLNTSDPIRILEHTRKLKDAF